MLSSKFATQLFLAFVVIFLTGCATVRHIDSAVSTHSTLRSLPVATYRFERLPSQQSPAQAPNQAALEAMAANALLAVGMKPVASGDASQPGYSVAVSAVVLRGGGAGWNDPWLFPGRIGIGIGVGSAWGRGARVGFNTGMYWGPGSLRYASPQWHREVGVVMRDLSTGQVVYETSAVHDGPWSDDQNVLPLMFQAAVSGFPTPPSERRIVNIALPPTPTPTPAGSAPTTPPVKP